MFVIDAGRNVDFGIHAYSLPSHSLGGYEE
jgi:hypothetical protein